jgi:hypothetical protein
MQPSMISPGDKVICVQDSFLRHEQAIFTKMPKVKKIYSVRETALNPTTEKQLVYLVGIYGCPLKGDVEPAFDANRFRSVSKSSHFMSAVGKADIIQVPVRVTPAIVDHLKGVPLFPQVEGFSSIADEGKLEVVCRRWISSHRLSKSMSEMHALVLEGIKEGPEAVMLVPISGLGMTDLLQVCARLGIHQEAWLQGVLGNLARRSQKMRDIYDSRLRNQRKR